MNHKKEQTAKDAAGEEVVYNAIAEKENLEITNKEYKSELDKLLTKYREVRMRKN